MTCIFLTSVFEGNIPWDPQLVSSSKTAVAAVVGISIPLVEMTRSWHVVQWCGSGGVVPRQSPSFLFGDSDIMKRQDSSVLLRLVSFWRDGKEDGFCY